LARVNKQAADIGITLELSEEVKTLLVNKGYDPNLGARPLRRAVQRYIEDPLAEELLLNVFTAGDTIVAEVAEDSLPGEEKIVFTKKAAPKGKKSEEVALKN
ncbi:MAG: ATP-dependent Clp protease ATP-binding subunit ClpC, partial [Chthonomonadaceae bacterium]|nr:ATP-dependent Clp protease ATP-binding subunit ClpC [Chthonomonadaceae bacterium]